MNSNDLLLCSGLQTRVSNGHLNSSFIPSTFYQAPLAEQIVFFFCSELFFVKKNLVCLELLKLEEVLRLELLT